MAHLNTSSPRSDELSTSDLDQVAGGEGIGDMIISGIVGYLIGEVAPHFKVVGQIRDMIK